VLHEKCIISVRKPEQKKREEDNIKMNVEERNESTDSSGSV
jgi:hypothetical protein